MVGRYARNQYDVAFPAFGWRAYSRANPSCEFAASSRQPLPRRRARLSSCCTFRSVRSTCCRKAATSIPYGSLSSPASTTATSVLRSWAAFAVKPRCTSTAVTGRSKIEADIRPLNEWASSLSAHRLLTADIFGGRAASAAAAGNGVRAHIDL